MARLLDLLGVERFRATPGHGPVVVRRSAWPPTVTLRVYARVPPDESGWASFLLPGQAARGLCVLREGDQVLFHDWSPGVADLLGGDWEAVGPAYPG